ncbi:hypothetical protein [Vreelandella maris]|uniref:Uncharacterized protein n=1 Tax=Vreelandella maris TaxID=2729617 RepID=A0A7Y6RFE0_9GAMM|nr:hypothetical protein [Halomonas maris]NVF15979.1 hypothetical protein [Halomonas maris]
MIDIQALTGLASSAFVGLIGAWAGVWFSLKRYRNEKWWEKKTSAYESIIEALHKIKRLRTHHLEAAETYREVPEETARRLRLESNLALEEIQRSIDIGALRVSTEAVQRLKQFQSDLVKENGARDWYSHLEIGYEAAESCIKDLISIAKKDLKID